MTDITVVGQTDVRLDQTDLPDGRSEPSDYQFHFTAQSPSSVKTSDLDSLASKRGHAFAERLKTSLDSLQFGRLSEFLRCDHASSPIPNASRNFILEDIQKLEGVHIYPNEGLVARFFMLGIPESEQELVNALGEGGQEIINEALELEIFRRTADGKIATNNLILCAHHLRDGQVIYFFGDAPNYIENRIGPERVYLGQDSYFLNARLQEYQDVDGKVLEMGSGSGLQLVTMLKLNPEIEQAIGVEIDSRARNVSVFNAALNGESERFSITEDSDELAQLLEGDKVSLAFSNPPFIPVPRRVRGYNQEGTRAVDLDLQELFPLCGWGGHDGLRITRQFVETMQSAIAPDGEIVIYSQFTGGDTGPIQVYDLAHELGFEGTEFEPFPRSHAYYNLTSSQWANYIAKHLASLHPDLPQEAQAWISGGTFSMLDNQRITKVHSGFMTLHGREARHTEPTRTNEDRLQLFRAMRGSSCLLRSLSGMITQKDLTQAEGIGGEHYTVPHQAHSQELEVQLSSQPLFQRRLLSDRGEYTLSVFRSEDKLTYAVTDTDGEIVETGSVMESANEPSNRYTELLQSVETIPATKLLRSWRIGAARVVDAEVINEVIGTDYSGDILVEGIPATHTFRISRYQSVVNDGSADLRMIELPEQVELMRLGIASPKGLELNARLREETKHWKL